MLEGSWDASARVARAGYEPRVLCSGLKAFSLVFMSVPAGFSEAEPKRLLRLLL